MAKGDGFTAVENKVYMLQVGTTKNPRYADRLLVRVKAAGYDGAFVTQITVDGNPYLCVQMGTAESKDEAISILTIARNKGFTDAFISSRAEN